MATLTINNNTFATSDTSITITFTTDVTPTAIELTKDGTNWISATSYTSSSATFDISNWGKGTYTNCQIRVSYVETGTIDPIEPIEPALIITNVTGGTFTVNTSATVTYTTSNTVIKHEYRMQKDYAYTDGTNKATSSGNNHTLTFDAGEVSVGTKNGSIRVTDANGNTAEADFTLIINETTQTPTTYTITKNLSNCTCSNSATSITSGSSYSATISANSGYGLSSLTVTMGGTNITSSAVSGSNISISNVTGNIVITASATQQETPSQPNPPSTGSALDDWDAFHNTYGNYVAYMADRVGVKGKSIRMTATATPTTVQGSVTKDYRSGAMVSKKAYKYGTFTFKFKISANNTLLWPMIWTLPDQTVAQDKLIGKNQRPEFDLLESWGALTNNSIVQTYHCTTPSGESKMNYLQGRTPVDLTQEHELKLVWTQDNVIKMYCDGVVKVTIKDYVTNWQTGEVDYQVWFINLGLGGFDGTAPNGTGWFELIDYDFQPVYTRDRVKQDYGMGSFSDGTLPSGPLPSSGGSSSDSGGSTPTTYTITKNLTNCTCSNSATTISSGSSYSANISANSEYTLDSIAVTMGGADITSSAVSGNSISISNVTGNIVITASASQASGGIDPIEPIDSLTINNITVMSATEANTQIMYVTSKAVTNHYFNMWYSGTDSGFTESNNKVTDMGNNTYTMTFINQLSAGTKTPAIKVEDVEGNTYIKTFDLTVTS